MLRHIPLTTEIRRRVQRALRTRHLSTALRSNTGAIDLASIMVGVIVIGVIAGIIAATVFAVIPWSQDKAAKQSLSAVHDAESVAYARGAEGGAAKYQDKSGLLASELIQDSSKVGIATDTDGTCYVGISAAPTGSVFYITDKTAVARPLTPTAEPGCLTPSELETLVSTVTGSAAASSTGMIAMLENADGSMGLYNVGSTSINRIGDVGYVVTQDGSAAYKGWTYFSAETAVGGSSVDGELWRTDGSAIEQAANIYDEIGDTHGSYPQDFIVYKDLLYFSAEGYNDTDGASGRELWSFDGTTATLAADISEQSGGSNPLDLVVSDGKLFFSAVVAAAGRELYSFDGTTASMVSDINSGAGDGLAVSQPWATDPYFTSFDGQVWFDSDDGTGTALTSFDGTSVTRWPALSTTRNRIVVGQHLYMSGDTGFWHTDGSTLIEVADIRVANTKMVAVGSRVYFQGYNGGSGYDLWTYDGTTMTMLTDDSTSAYDLTAVNGTVFFCGMDSNYIWSLWSVQGSGLPVLVPGTFDAYSFDFGVTIDGQFLFGNRIEPDVNVFNLYKTDGSTTAMVSDTEFDWFVPLGW